MLHHIAPQLHRRAANVAGQSSGTRPLATSRRLPSCRAVRQQKQQQQQQQQQQDPHEATQQQQQQQQFQLQVPSLVAGDAEKEQSRQYRRTTFDHERWALHRSTGRYWRHIRSMGRSRVIKGLAPPLIYVGAVSALVCCYETLLKHGDLAAWGLHDAPSLAITTSGVFSISTFALSLLLVFRTNSAYARWNDARKLWGLTTNRCRDLSRQVTQWLTDPADAELAAALCRHIKAFPLALMASLRLDHSLEADLRMVLQPAEVDLLLRQPHVGTAVLQVMGVLVAASSARELHKLRIDENITVLQDTMGGCERIFRTPIPLFYTRHTSRFLICWLTILPFCTADSVGWLTVPIACGVAFFLLGIEEIGVQVEEPFGILSLEVFSSTIIKNVSQAEQAAADMRAMAAAHAAGRDGGSAVPAAAVPASTASSSGSGSGSPAGVLGSAPPNRLDPPRVAGRPVAAAEEAFNVSCSATYDDSSSSSSARDRRGGTASSCSSSDDSSSASLSSEDAMPGGTASSMGGARDSSKTPRSAGSRGRRAAVPAVATSSEESDGYTHSSVAAGAVADADEGFMF